MYCTLYYYTIIAAIDICSSDDYLFWVVLMTLCSI